MSKSDIALTLMRELIPCSPRSRLFITHSTPVGKWLWMPISRSID